jgi:hypothetical protein
MRVRDQGDVQKLMHERTAKATSFQSIHGLVGKYPRAFSCSSILGLPFRLQDIVLLPYDVRVNSIAAAHRWLDYRVFGNKRRVRCNPFSARKKI